MSQSRSGRWSRRGGVLAVALIAPAFAAASPLASTGEMVTGEAKVVALPKVVPQVFNGDVRDLPRAASARLFHAWEHEGTPIQVPPAAVGASPPNLALAPMPSPSRSFSGLGFDTSVSGGQAGAAWPPDPNGDVGPNHYIEAVNDAFGIFDKAGTLLAAFTERALWNGAGSSPCNGEGQGDPIVVHDALADRWILTNFAFGVDSNGKEASPFYECIAVSRTSDPVAGGWFLYAIRMDTGGAGLAPVDTLDDYPKFGIWTDCLYMSANAYSEPAGTFAGTIIASFSRSDMYAGADLTLALAFLPNKQDPFTMIPSTLLGTSTGSLPPPGTPDYFVSQSELDFVFEVRKFTAGANCGGGGTLSAPTNVGETTYQVADGDIVPQPNTSNLLDSLGFRLMQKVPYRRIGNAESLWVTHTVLSGAKGSTSAPHWAQLDVTGGVIATTLVQQQVYVPDGALHRWMPSLAVDGQGNMAIGYSTSNGTSPDFPSIAYSGRLAGDPLNNLPETERQLIAGSGSQTNSVMINGKSVPNPRWGDYTAMSIDPADDCTFWYVNEYYDSQANGAAGIWKTAIGSFKFPSCAPTGTGACVPGPTTLCVDQDPGDGRFQVRVSYHTTQGGSLSGSGNAIPLSSLGVTQGGLFWFFGATNPEMLIKIIDGCALDSHFWVFYAATTNVGFTVTVTDTLTGHQATYTNHDQTAAPPQQDTSALACP